MMCFNSHSILNDDPTNRRVSKEEFTKFSHTASSNRAGTKLKPRLSARSYKSTTNFADQYELNDLSSEDHDDGKGMEFCKITFGCNQRFPTVALSPPTYSHPRMSSKARSSLHDHFVAPSSILDFAPHLHLSVDPNRSQNILKMFRSKSKRQGIKYSAFATDLDPKAKTQSTKPVVSSPPMSCSDFDAMLRSNQTIYVQGMTTNTSLTSCDSREVLYSNIPLSSNQKPAHT